MKVTINQKEQIFDDENMTVSQLLKLRKMRKAAVWINGVQLLAAEYDSHTIQEGDQIKLLRIMAGG